MCTNLNVTIIIQFILVKMSYTVKHSASGKLGNEITLMYTVWV